MVFAQPGMRYAIAKALVHSLKQDEFFKSQSEANREYIAAKILSDVKGRMLEDIVLLETTKAAPRTSTVFRFKFDKGGEYDMVVYDSTTNSCKLYEVKHSTEITKRQAIHLRDADKCAIIEKRISPISGKYVLYRGEDAVVDGVQYLNVEKYLCSLR